MPVIDRQHGVTGWTDAQIKAWLPPKPRRVVVMPRNDEALRRIAASSVELDRAKNPSRSPARVIRTADPKTYRPGGLLYRP